MKVGLTTRFIRNFVNKINPEDDLDIFSYKTIKEKDENEDVDEKIIKVTIFKRWMKIVL